MAHKPFFSIVIPTYNRAKLLKAAISITLLQTYTDFELIISNNCSTDNTHDVVKSFKDKRIRYFENKKNIGGEPNMKKAFSYARGKYIFTLGDDDFILFENTLERLKKMLDEKQYGFVRLNLIEKKFIGSGIQKNIMHQERDIEIKKNAKPEKIIEFFSTIRAAHFAGLVIKNSEAMKEEFLTFPIMAWIKIIFYNTKKFGAYYVADLYMIITWSQGDILTHYNPREDNRLMFEQYTDYILSVIPKEKRSMYSWNYFKDYIMLQPAVKLYSNNKNMITFDRRLFTLEPRLKQNIRFWLMFVIAFVFPKSVWRLVRVVQHKKRNKLDVIKNKEKIIEKYNYYNSHYF